MSVQGGDGPGWIFGGGLFALTVLVGGAAAGARARPRVKLNELAEKGGFTRRTTRTLADVTADIAGRDGMYVSNLKRTIERAQERGREAFHLFMSEKGKSTGGTLSLSFRQRVGEDKDLNSLRARFPEIRGVLSVDGAHVDEKIRGQGLGKLMYEHVARQAAELGYAIAPSSHFGGVTVDAANRVWSSLKRDYPHEGNVIFGL